MDPTPPLSLPRPPANSLYVLSIQTDEVRRLIHRIFTAEWNDASANVHQLQRWAAANDPPPAPPPGTDITQSQVEKRVSRAVDLTLRLISDFSIREFESVFGFKPSTTTTRNTLLWIQHHGLDRERHYDSAADAIARFASVPLSPPPWPTLALTYIAPEKVNAFPSPAFSTV